MAGSSSTPDPDRTRRMQVRFDATSWTAVMAAGGGETPEAQVALTQLCQDYWPPLHAYVRRLGKSREEALDLTQQFFYVLLSKNYLGAADRRKGKFRTFLLTALNRFLTNDWQKSQALKRGGGVLSISLDDDQDGEGSAVQPSTEISPLKLFEQRWASTILQAAMNRLEAELSAAGKEKNFKILRPFLDDKYAYGGYNELAGQLDMSQNAIRVTVHRLRAQLAELVRAEVARTMANPTPEEVEEEVQHLFDAFAS
jgi:RNA polymerase sigma-70 factor (ECF subfamily)